LCAAIEFGLQPELFYKTSAAGAHVPLYSPFHLSQSIPTMLGAHLLVAGVVELALTAGVIAYLQRANVPLLQINHPTVPEADEQLTPVEPRPRVRGLLLGLAAMLALVPLGLVTTGGAFGEDTPAQLDLRKYGLHAVPAGLEHYSDFWSHSLLPGYDFKGSHPTIGYYTSALVGTLLILAVGFGAFRIVVRVRQRRTVEIPARR
jgi:cobalt/nickel transport system permease protein